MLQSNYNGSLQTGDYIDLQPFAHWLAHTIQNGPITYLRFMANRRQYFAISNEKNKK
jgi:hypothetical protein